MSDYMQQRVEVTEDYDFCDTCHYRRCRCEETILTGRYDREPRMLSLLRKAFELRMACQAQEHKLGELTMNLSTNVMECSNCNQTFDMNELVHPALRVPRQIGITASDISDLKKASNL